MSKFFKVIFALQIFLAIPLAAKFEFKLSNGAKLEVDTKETPQINSIFHSPKLRLLASASKNLICIWDAKNFKLLQKIYDVKIGDVNEIVCTQDFNSVYIASGNPAKEGQVLLLNLKDKKIETLLESKDEFLSIAISSDGKYLASGSADGKLAIISTSDNSIIASDVFSNAKVVSLKFNVTSNTLAILLSNGQVISRNSEDSFKSNATSLSVGGGAQNMLFLNRAEIGLPIDSTYGGKFATVQRFLPRTLRYAKIPIEAPSAVRLRYNAKNLVAMASFKGELLTMRSSIDNPNFTFFEKSPSPILDIAPCAMASILASTLNGEIFIWSELDKRISGGIVICDESCESYAVFASSGSVFASDKKILKVVAKDGRDISDSVFSESKTASEISKIGRPNTPKKRAKTQNQKLKKQTEAK